MNQVAAVAWGLLPVTSPTSIARVVLMTDLRAELEVHNLYLNWVGAPDLSSSAGWRLYEVNLNRHPPTRTITIITIGTLREVCRAALYHTNFIKQEDQ